MAGMTENHGYTRTDKIHRIKPGLLRPKAYQKDYTHTHYFPADEAYNILPCHICIISILLMIAEFRRYLIRPHKIHNQRLKITLHPPNPSHSSGRSRPWNSTQHLATAIFAATAESQASTKQGT